MRVDSVDAFLDSPLRVPRYVVGIIFPVSSPYFTSHSGMSNVPGVNVVGVIKGISGSSQRIFPSQGRSTIGGITIELVDVSSSVTDELRSQLDSGEGIQGRTVEVYDGDSDDFNDLVQVETFIVDDVTLQDGVYRIRCVDRKRELRKDIFEPKKTRLSATLTDSATTVTVIATADFATIVHTAAFSDAPSSTVGYIRLKKTGEIIRYTGKTATTFTGCTREVLGTKAQAITIDGGTATEKLPEVEELIYLEMPVVQIIHSVMTGTIFGTANPLPAHWNLGVATADVRDADYNNIGLDLFDSSDTSAGQIARFVGLTKTDGKRWIEKELLLMIGCFMPIGADGILGLKRLPRILEVTPYARILDSSNIVSHSQLQHNLKAMANQVRIDWNWDGKQYTRTTLVLDGESITTHGVRPAKTFRFKGLAGLRSTDQTIQIIASTFLDRAAEPPEQMTVTCLPSQNDLEVGDVVRVVLPGVLDFAGTGTLNRSFLIEGRFIDWVTGRVTFKLFGSSREAEVVAPKAGVPVPDGMYDDEGVALSTVLTIVADAVTTNGTLTGNVDMNAAGAIFYHLGNLTINAGVTVTGIDNVQLRIRGFLTINGKLDLKGNGLAGVADTNSVPVVLGERGLAGFIGHTHGSFGIRIITGGSFNFRIGSSGPQFGLHSAFPLLALSLVDTDTTPKLLGIPTDFRGTSGGPGGAISTTPSTVNENGTTGGDSGGGLYILCRGLGFGASGSIDTSGDDGVTPPSFASYLGVDLFEGAGGGGAPGGLLILLDGDTVSLPSLSGKFIGDLGNTPMQGTPGERGQFGSTIFPTEPGTGGPGIGPASMAAAVSRIQYVPSDEEVGDSEDEVVPPPTTLAAAAGGAGVVLSWVNPPAGRFNYIEVFESLTNNRSSAVLIGRVNTEEAVRLSDAVITRFYWIRARHELLGVSTFEPLSSTAGVEVTFGGLPAGSLVGTVNLDTQVSGTLATGNAETGLINVNVTINPSGTLGGAGGGQASLDSLPGTVSVGSAEAGLINVNITINATGTLGGAGGGQANLANLPGLIINTQINVSNVSSINVNMGAFTAGTIVVTGTLEGSIKMVNVQTFTPGWTGFSTAPTGTVSYVDYKNFAMIFFPASRTGISNSSSMGMTGVPSAIRPGVTTAVLSDVNRSNIRKGGEAFILTTGTVTFSRTNVVSSMLDTLTTGWAVTGNKGIFSGTQWFYPL